MNVLFCATVSTHVLRIISKVFVLHDRSLPKKFESLYTKKVYSYNHVNSQKLLGSDRLYNTKVFEIIFRRKCSCRYSNPEMCFAYIRNVPYVLNICSFWKFQTLRLLLKYYVNDNSQSLSDLRNTN